MPDSAAETPPAAPAVAPVAAAIETLVFELEREQSWLADLRADTERAERTCQRLLASVESAIGTLPPAQARPFYQRIMRQRNETPRMGRPPRDGRQAAVMDLLAWRGEGPVTNAEIRAHLEQHGLKSSVGYVGGLLSMLAKEEVVMRLSMGRYAINTHHDRLRRLRWRRIAESEWDLLKAQGRLLKSGIGLPG